MIIYKLIKMPFILCVGAILTIISGMYSIIELISILWKAKK
jgi:hypothetical protein